MRLNSDNPDTMPITDAVYGQQRRKPSKPSTPRGHSTQVWERASQSVVDGLARTFPRVRRLAAQKRTQ